mgnify:CR=1 FL=1
MTEEPPTTAVGARRRTGAALVAAATIISIVGPLLIALIFLRPALAGGSGAGIPLPWSRLAWLAMLGIGISVGPIIGVVVMSRRSARRQARLLALAQAKDGRVCPWCGGDPPLSPDDAPCCRRNVKGWTPEHYQRYWGLAATDGGAATAFLVQTGNVTATTLWRWSSVAVLLPFAFMPAISGQRGWMWETAGSLVFLSICAVGASIALGGFWRFSEFAPLCAACRYPRSGSTPRCPECGHDWSARYTGTVMGRRNVARGRVFVGASIAFVGILLFATGRFWMGAVIVRLQSSSALIESTQATYSFEQRHAWAELQRRTLSPAEQSALFDHLLDSRRVQLWIHGHTHDSFDYLVKGTRVLCNPRGYVKEEVNENRAFDPDLIVDTAELMSPD